MKTLRTGPSGDATFGLSPQVDVTAHRPTCRSTRVRRIRSFGGRQIYGTMLRHGAAVFGVVRDLLFDNRDWSIRYLVVETGTWPSPRRVLLEPPQVSTFNLESRSITTSLTQSQVENCPLEQTYPPVSQQYAIRVAGPPSTPLHWADNLPVVSTIEHDPCLESGQELLGYSVCGGAARGERVSDLQVQTPDDCFRPKIEAVVTRSLWGWGPPGQIPVGAVEQIDFQQRRVLVATELLSISRESEGTSIAEP